MANQLTETLGGPARSRVVLMLAAVLGLVAADTGAVGALAAPLEGAFHMGNTQLGLLVSVTTLVGAGATLPFGVVVDRLSRTRLLAAVILLWGLATVAGAMATSYAMLLASRLVLGALVAAAGPAVASLVGDLFPADERGRLYGFVLTGELVGAGFGILAAGGLAGLLGWRPALGILALPAFALAGAFLRYFPEPARGGQALLEVGATEIVSVEEAGGDFPMPGGSGGDPAGEPEISMVEEQAVEQGIEPDPDVVLETVEHMGNWEAIRYIIRVRTNVALIVASGLGYFFLQGLQTFAVLFLRDRFGIGQSAASLLFVAVALGAVAGVLLSGQIADRLIRKGRTNSRMVVAAASFVAASLLFVPGALSTALFLSLPLFLLAAVALGAVNPPADAARLDVMPSQVWGRAESVRTALRSVLQGLAPLLFGLLSGVFGGRGSGFGSGVDSGASHASSAAGQGLAMAFIVLSIPLIVAGVVLWLSRNRYLRDAVASRRSKVALIEAGEAPAVC